MELLVYITVPDKNTGLRLAEDLVKKGFAAGVNISGPVCSIYRWQGEIREKDEWQLFAQTDEDRFEALARYTAENHPYQTPCIIAMEIKEGHKEFLEWIRN